MTTLHSFKISIISSMLVRPVINYLLRNFRRWLINEKMKQRLADSRKAHTKTAYSYSYSNTIWWIEKLLQTPLSDYRKFAVWRILAPYLINIRKCSVDVASSMIRDWLDKCRNLRQLDFSPNNVIRSNINSAMRGGFLPISLEKLKIENPYLYNLLAKS